jgi:DnaK suppressor protein
MPSKKSNKTARKPAKASPKKATRKVAAVKKAAARAPAAAKPPIITSKVPVKHKPGSKPTPAKPAPAHAARAKTTGVTTKPDTLTEEVKPSAEKVTTIKFDTRPLTIPPRAATEEDADGETSVSALLAGPRNVKPYIARRGEQYMSKEQLEHFARILQNWKRDLMEEVDRTVLHMKDEAANFPDPNDRATQEEEFSLELRTRDRERKLIRKIDEALKRIEDGTYGYCLETGEEIGIKRLEARPVATLSVEAQERRERREKQYGDRDDRYR